MDIVEIYAEYISSLLILLFSFNIIFIGIIEPTMESIQINYEARGDKAVTFTNSLNEGQGIHDQKVGRTPGVDPISGYDERDSGLSRMYFRPEQFVMLPAVDTDVSSNPNVYVGTRVNTISTEYTKVGTSVNPSESRGLEINKDPFALSMSYAMTRDSLYDKQITYDSVNTQGLLNSVKQLIVYPQIGYGTQIIGNQNPMKYGGFNITLDAAIHPISGKESNSVIFVAGRVPSK